MSCMKPARIDQDPHNLVKDRDLPIASDIRMPLIWLSPPEIHTVEICSTALFGEMHIRLLFICYSIIQCMYVYIYINIYIYIHIHIIYIYIYHIHVWTVSISFYFWYEAFVQECLSGVLVSAEVEAGKELVLKEIRRDQTPPMHLDISHLKYDGILFLSKFWVSTLIQNMFVGMKIYLHQTCRCS